MQWLFRCSLITRRRFDDAGGLLKLKTTTASNNNYIENGGGWRWRWWCYSTTTTTTTGGSSKSKSSSSRISSSSLLVKKKIKKVINDDDDCCKPAAAAPKDKKKKNGLLYNNVVRKGDIVGVYNNSSLLVDDGDDDDDDDDDDQPQVGCHLPPPVTLFYKGGYNISKEAQAYLLSHGLKDALYSITAVDFRQHLFGTLVPCPFQHPHGEPETMFLGSQTGRACILEFDGACKGNPGISGAGAVLRTPDGTLFCRLREGLGIATNNVAEYRAMILGLRYALSKGFTSIYVVGDSKLVCMQIQGLWRARHPNMIKWYEEAKKLKDEFLFFQANHVLRAKNSAADAQANLAVVLAVGEVQEEDVDTMKTDDSQSQESMVLLS